MDLMFYNSLLLFIKQTLYVSIYTGVQISPAFLYICLQIASACEHLLYKYPCIYKARFKCVESSIKHFTCHSHKGKRLIFAL